jgi:hypothetical protein
MEVLHDSGLADPGFTANNYDWRLQQRFLEPRYKRTSIDLDDGTTRGNCRTYEIENGLGMSR